MSSVPVITSSPAAPAPPPPTTDRTTTPTRRTTDAPPTSRTTTKDDVVAAAPPPATTRAKAATTTVPRDSERVVTDVQVTVVGATAPASALAIAVSRSTALSHSGSVESLIIDGNVTTHWILGRPVPAPGVSVSIDPSSGGSAEAAAVEHDRSLGTAATAGLSLLGLALFFLSLFLVPALWRRRHSCCGAPREPKKSHDQVQGQRVSRWLAKHASEQARAVEKSAAASTPVKAKPTGGWGRRTRPSSEESFYTPEWTARASGGGPRTPTRTGAPPMMTTTTLPTHLEEAYYYEGGDAAELESQYTRASMEKQQYWEPLPPADHPAFFDRPHSPMPIPTTYSSDNVAVVVPTLPYQHEQQLDESDLPYDGRERGEHRRTALLYIRPLSLGGFPLPPGDSEKA